MLTVRFTHPCSSSLHLGLKTQQAAGEQAALPVLLSMSDRPRKGFRAASSSEQVGSNHTRHSMLPVRPRDTAMSLRSHSRRLEV